MYSKSYINLYSIYIQNSKYITDNVEKELLFRMLANEVLDQLAHIHSSIMTIIYR